MAREPAPTDPCLHGADSSLPLNLVAVWATCEDTHQDESVADLFLDAVPRVGATVARPSLRPTAASSGGVSRSIDVPCLTQNGTPTE